MTTWSRAQSQDANRRAIKSTTSPSSKSMGNLQPLSEAQKRANRRLNGTQMPFASAVGPVEIVKPKERDYIAPTKPGFIPAKPRGRSGSRLNPAHRAMVERKAAMRAAFFASL